MSKYVDEICHRHQPYETPLPGIPQRRRLHIWNPPTRPRPRARPSTNDRRSAERQHRKTLHSMWQNTLPSTFDCSMINGFIYCSLTVQKLQLLYVFLSISPSPFFFMKRRKKIICFHFFRVDFLCPLSFEPNSIPPGVFAAAIQNRV